MSQEQLVHKLIDRAAQLAIARQFFSEKGIIEVDCHALQKRAPIDTHIEVMKTEIAPHTFAYLHTSPEYQMKKLLSLGMRDIFFLGHVFRKNDLSPFHNPEFTMAEWYRIGFSIEKMIEETVQFISLFIPKRPITILTYREAFQKYVGIDYTKDPLQELVTSHGGSSLWDHETSLHFLLSKLIEPHLGKGEFTALTSYPVAQAALARTKWHNGEEVALRFEIYSDGIELANGYHELSDPQILKQRFAKENERRESVGLEKYILDTSFLEAMNDSFPNCCGVSVGFDRVMMLRHFSSTITSISGQWEPLSPSQMPSATL